MPASRRKNEYLVRVNFVKQTPLKGPREQMVQLAHGDSLAELIEVQHTVEIRVVQLDKEISGKNDQNKQKNEI